MRAVFLDRDGVINKYPGDTKYVTRWPEFRFLPRAKEAIAKLSKNNFRIFVVSNQAGVGKGIFTQEDLNMITAKMLSAIKESGGKIDAVYYCTHSLQDNCSCRKPKTGLLKKAKNNYKWLNLKETFFIGDSLADVHTAKAAGCKSILVLSGKEKLSRRNKTWEIHPDFIFKDLWGAAKFILKEI